jgi:uncharacterized protein YoaH (UPF0181 family)
MRDLQDPLPDVEPEFTHEEEQDDVSKIQSLMRELDMSGGVARIFRQRPGQAKHEYEGEIPADTFNLETIKRAYGGGDYQVRFAAKGGRYVRSIRFSIDPRHKGELDKVHETQTPVTQTNDNSQALLAFMMSQQQAQAQQSQQSMTLMMTMMNESQKSMAAIIAAAIGGGRQAVPDTSNKFIEIMMPMLTESMKPRGGMSELTENVKLVKELMSGAPEKEEKDDMLEKMMTIGAPLIGAFMSRGQPQQPQPQPVRVNPVQPTQSLPPTQEQLAQSKAQDLLGKLRFVTPVLVRAAKKSSYLDSYVDILNDSLDDEGHEMLVYMLQRDDWISTLFNDNPDVVANRQWFEQLREAILTPEDESTDPTGEAAPEPAKESEAPHPFS